MCRTLHNVDRKIEFRSSLLNGFRDFLIEVVVLGQVNQTLSALLLLFVWSQGRSSCTLDSGNACDSEHQSAPRQAVFFAREYRAAARAPASYYESADTRVFWPAGRHSRAHGTPIRAQQKVPHFISTPRSPVPLDIRSFVRRIRRVSKECYHSLTSRNFESRLAILMRFVALYRAH
jgi:hypothetical protein